MKKIAIAFVILAIGQIGVAQNHRAQQQQQQQQPPTNVQRSFQRDYPQANDARWSRYGNRWNANFTDRSSNDNGAMVSHYDHNGRHLDSHIPYDRNDVPSNIRERMERRYPHARDYRYTRIEDYGGQPLFQVHLSIGGSPKTMYIDEQGRERSYNDRH